MLQDDSDVSGYMQLSRVLARGDALAFIGPEFSCLAGAPTPSDLASSLRADLNMAASDAPLAAIAQAFRDQFGDYALYARLRAAIEATALRPTHAHTLLCDLPFLVHITTNPDSLLEETLRALKYPVHVIADAPSLDDWDETREVQVLKLHGDLSRPDTVAVAERDVAHIIRRGSVLREKLTTLMRYRTSVFIGYSITDPNLRLLLAAAAEDAPPPTKPNFAITYDTDPELLAEWRKNTIRPVVVEVREGESRYDAFVRTLEAITSLIETRPQGCDVLVVDDEPSLRLGFKMMIERAMPGVTVEAAEDGVGALLRLDGLRPRVMLVDLIMPNMNGWELIEKVKARPEYQYMRYIVLTGMENPDWMARAESLDIPYVMKPFDHREFLRIVAKQLKPRKVR